MTQSFMAPGVKLEAVGAGMMKASLVVASFSFISVEAKAYLAYQTPSKVSFG